MYAALGCGAIGPTKAQQARAFIITETRRLTVSPSPDFSPSWHPDGSQLAFISVSSGDWVIWSTDRHGTQLRKILETHAVRYSSPIWAPDGASLLFSANRTSGLAHLWLMHAQEQTFEELTHDPNSKDLLPAWSPDGGRIAFLAMDFSKPSKWVLTLLDRRSNQRRILTDEAVEFSTPAWSPDGREIAFTSTRSENAEIWTVDPEGVHFRQLTHHPALDEHPTWSPDGETIVFMSDRTGHHELWSMDRFGQSARRLTRHRAHNGHPVWSPDGSAIAYVSDRSGNEDIWLLEISWKKP